MRADAKKVIGSFVDCLGAENVFIEGPKYKAAFHDESDMPPVPPLCVVTPRVSLHVKQIVDLCLSFEVPLTARGAGTSLEGSAIPAPGSVVVDFSLMDAVHDLVPEEQRVTVGPGMVYERLNRLLKSYGLFFPPAPGGSADVATIGGMVSTDASGIYALGYGATRRWVLALDVVTGRGEEMRVGSFVPKTSMGYSLKDLFIGSEGTLGLITAVTLRLAPLPVAAQKSGFIFPDLAECCAAAAEMTAYVPELVAIELCDEDTLQVLKTLYPDLPEGHTLFVEAHGRDCTAAIEAAREIADSHLGRVLPEGTHDPWELRHRTTNVIRELCRPHGVVRSDCAVPLQYVPSFVAEAKARATPRKIFVFGHIGLGILHLLFPLGGPLAWSRAEAIQEKIALGLKAITLGGTASGEHGVGIANIELLAAEHPVGLAYMRAIKSIFDPHNIMNPDKVLG